MKWFGKKVTSIDASQATIRVGLVGNPNCGKSTVFNALTGASQHVGNWPGVTVERKSGYFAVKQTVVEVLDLPGIYSLTAGSALDERIAVDCIVSKQVDVILNIVDASHLERHFYLTLQLLEMGVPVLIGLNMMDVVRDRGIKIKVEQLAKQLGCQVVPLVARNQEGIESLKKAIIQHGQGDRPVAPTIDLECRGGQPVTPAIDYPPLVQEAIDAVGVFTLEGLECKSDQLVALQAAEWQAKITTELGEDADILIADARYRFIQTLAEDCISKAPVSTTWTQRLDAIILNRILGIPIFLLIMYSLFFFAINVGGAFQDFFDISSNTLFVDGLAQGLAQLGAPSWLIALLAHGVGKGINTVVTFIPVIGAMFLGLAFLEDSGYMARAAFIVDRAVRLLGLPGKSFVPLIVGFGCNVPAVMAARTLENHRDRILTVMMTPFMSCSARLAIYAAFTAAFFPAGGQNIVFALYLTGIVVAILTGWILRKTVLQGEPTPFVMELPNYHWPRAKTLLLNAWQRLNGFVLRAGKLILPLCILLGVLNTLTLSGSLSGEGSSILASVGHWVTPVFAPMGIQADNWPAAVGLMTGVLAKEVVVGTLNSLYSQIGQLAVMPIDSFHLGEGLKQALMSIPVNLSQLGGALMNPVLAKAPIHTLNQPVYHVMAEHFDGPLGVIAYLLFVLLYFPCVSTIAVMWRELGRRWTCFSVLWTTGLAYSVAVAFYQIGTFIQHPVFSSVWLSSLGGLFLLTIIVLRLLAGGKSCEFAHH